MAGGSRGRRQGPARRRRSSSSGLSRGVRHGQIGAREQRRDAEADAPGARQVRWSCWTPCIDSPRLSDDLVLLERVATIAARRIDAFRLSEERYERVLREREIRTLATEALPDQPTQPGMASGRLKPTAHGHIATADRNALSPSLTTPIS